MYLLYGINDYLIKKGFNNLVASKVSERLIKEGYLNDLKYAKSFINDSMNLTNKGPQKIKMELIKYGVNKDIIESEIALIDQRKVEEKLNKLIDKELKIKKGSQNAIKIKIINHFVNLGYSKDLVTSILMSKEITSDKSKLKKDYAKLYNKISDKNNGWVNTDIKELFRVARVSVKYRNDKFLYLNDLETAGLISFSNKNDNLNLRVTFIDDDSETILRVDDFRELGYEYLNHIGDGKFIRCKCCKMLVKKKSNNDRSTKYCNNCAKEVQNKQKYEWDKKNRKSEKAK